jgi:nickel-dependent lactate racemase
MLRSGGQAAVIPGVHSTQRFSSSHSGWAAGQLSGRSLVHTTQ